MKTMNEWTITITTCCTVIDNDYETALIVASMDSLKDRHETLMARFFKKQVLASNALLHYLFHSIPFHLFWIRQQRSINEQTKDRE